MSYLSLYRKYRPQSFEDVVGQEPVVRTLRNALQRGRVAHAYMFSGPRGTGKTSLARLLAKGLNCVQGPTRNPVTLFQLQTISEGYAMDVVRLTAQTGVSMKFGILGRMLDLLPPQVKYKVYH